jgi:hypothetical protein
VLAETVQGNQMSFHPKLRWRAFFQPPDVGFRISMVSVSINESVAVDVSYARKLIGNPSVTGLIQQSVSEPMSLVRRCLENSATELNFSFVHMMYQCTWLMQCLLASTSTDFGEKLWY